MDVKSLIFTGGGEPTLHPELDKMVKEAHDIGLEWGMFTHGLKFNEILIHSLLKYSPRFLRISVNSGSAFGHKQEYRIGLHTYELVKQNAILAAKISKEYRKCIGLGYAINGKISNQELIGIKEFILDVFERSIGALKSVAFRPKVLYYNSKESQSKNNLL